MCTFIFSAHDAARLMKANLDHDHYEAASSAHEDPKQLWQGVTVNSSPLFNTALGIACVWMLQVHISHKQR